MKNIITNRINLKFNVKLSLSLLFAAAGIAFPVVVATSDSFLKNRANFQNDSSNGLQISRPSLDLQTGDKSMLKDLQYRVKGIDTDYSVTKIRLFGIHEEPSAWISQSCIDSARGEKHLSRPYQLRKEIPRYWLPKNKKYYVNSNTYTSQAIVISDSEVVSFE